MANRPKMIGAHVPKKSIRRRVGLYGSAKDFNRAYDERFCTNWPHIAWQQPGTQGER